MKLNLCEVIIAAIVIAAVFLSGAPWSLWQWVILSAGVLLLLHSAMSGRCGMCCSLGKSEKEMKKKRRR